MFQIYFTDIKMGHVSSQSRTFCTNGSVLTNLMKICLRFLEGVSYIGLI